MQRVTRRQDATPRLWPSTNKIGTTSGPITYPVMIYIDRNTGMIYAAGDPEARRHAAALARH
ncbi:MAG TPA: hypothetical protein VMW72_10820 [Sedimentisphaerales bacterium]|nr:hypothetical protein [Sedimentisphaerales bacterium]